MTELEKLDRDVVWHPFTQMQTWEPLVITRGDGNYLFDELGTRYFDGVSSLWCNVFGHGHPRLLAALKDQAERLCHSTFLGLTHEPGIRLAAKLVAAAPAGLQRVFYSDSGSTAVEIALKQSFQYWQLVGRAKKTKFVRFENAYHGDTLGAVSVGGIDIFHKVFGPLLIDSIAVRSPYEPRWSPETGQGATLALAQLDEVLQRNDEIAAVVMEPLVQGAAGMLVHPAGFLKSVEQRCRAAGVHLIVDEVATGFGRTGKIFASEHEDVRPDFLCLAKGISGGYLPLAATLSTEAIYTAFLGQKSDLKQFFHGHTYTANPLACALGVATIEMLHEDQRWRGVAEETAKLASGFSSHSHVREVRSCGSMTGIELGADQSTALDWGRFSGAEVCRLARKRGVMLRPLGDTIIWMPPLSSSVEELAQLAKSTREAIDEYFAG